MPKRRGRGEGSYEPRGKPPHILWRWVGSIRGQKIRTKFYPTKKEADEERQKIQGKPVAVGTLGDWLDIWLPLHKSTAAATTYANDLDTVDRYIRPKFGPMKLRDLSRLAIRTWLSELTCSASERHKAAAMLRKVLNAAVENEKLAASPMVRIKLPSVKRDERRAMTAEQLRTLAEAAGDRRAMILVQVDACLRPGELLGLKWGDFDGETLSIQRAVCRETGKLKDLKTKRSRRILPLSKASIEALGPTDGYDPSEPMFPSKQGNHPSPRNWSRRIFAPIRRRAGLPWVMPNTLRHTGASLLLSAGVNILIVSRRLGHTDPGVTLKIYSHIMPDDQAKAAAKFDDLLGVKVLPQNVPQGT